MENESPSKEIGGRERQGGKWGPQALQQVQRGCLFLWSLLQQMSGKGLLHLCQKRWGRDGHEHSWGRHYPRSTFPSRGPCFSWNIPPPPHPTPPTQAGLVSPSSELTCTVIRLFGFGVWLGLGLSSQKFSVTWNLGGGPRPWKYLAKSDERERVKGWKQEREERGHRQEGNREGPSWRKSGDCRAEWKSGLEQELQGHEAVSSHQEKCQQLCCYSPICR